MRARTLLVAVGLTFGVCVSLAACGQADSQVDAQVFTKVERAPSEPPTVSVEGSEIAPSYYEWIVDGESVTFKAAEDQDDAPLTDAPPPAGETLSVVLGSAVRPGDFRVVFFEDVDENGVPTAGAGVEVNCLEDDACSLRREDGEISATVQLTSAPRIAVVHLLYADVFGPDDDVKVDHFVGSWGVRFDDKEKAS